MSDDDFRSAVLAKLEALEARTAQIWARVDNLEKRATLWGAVSGAVAILATKLLGGCM